MTPIARSSWKIAMSSCRASPMRRATPICIVVASRWWTVSTIPAIQTRKSWMRAGCRRCSPCPMPDDTVIKQAFLPYGRQEIADPDIRAVVEALTSDWLTTGPRVSRFEQAFADFCHAREGVAVNSGTAALHCAIRALGVGPGDEVIVPAITFAASANAAVYEG